MQTIKIPFPIYLSLSRVYRILIKQKKLKTFNFWVLTSHQKHANQPIKFRMTTQFTQLRKSIKDSRQDKKGVSKLPEIKRKKIWFDKEREQIEGEGEIYRNDRERCRVCVLSLCVFWSWHLNLYYTRSKTLSLSLSSLSTM